MMTRKRKMATYSNIKDKWGLRIPSIPVVSAFVTVMWLLELRLVQCGDCHIAPGFVLFFWSQGLSGMT